jgi:predicted HTH transcriptional regulator
MSGDEAYDIDTLGLSVAEAIDAGETPAIEFKRQFTEQASGIAKEVVALTNNGGGVLFLGVADDGRVVGLEEPRAVGERVAGVVQDIQSPVDLDILNHAVRSRQILSVIVPGYRHLPRAYDYVFYQRRGTTRQKLTPAEVWELMPGKNGG